MKICEEILLAQKLSHKIEWYAVIYPYLYRIPSHCLGNIRVINLVPLSWWSISRYRSLAFLNAMALQLQGLRVELNEEKTIKLKASKALLSCQKFVWILELARFCCMLFSYPAKFTWSEMMLARKVDISDISWKFPCFSVFSRLP